MAPYENGRGCPKCRFAPNGCPSGCHVKPYHENRKGETLTPERKVVLHEERMERRRIKKYSAKSVKTAKSVPDFSSTPAPGDTWIHKDSEIRVVSRKHREDGSCVVSVCVTPLAGNKKSRTRQLCNSTVNLTRVKGQYGRPMYAQVASCSCMHCYHVYMPRQWSNDLRSKINLAIRHGKDYHKYEPLIGVSRDKLIAYLMEKMRIRYGLDGLTWDDVVSGRYPFEIDEIIPRRVLYIEVNDVDEWTRIFNYKNLQLLTKEHNVKKGLRIESVTDLDVFSSIFSMEGARRVVIDSRLDWIRRRMKRGLELLDVEKEFFEIHDRSIFF
jgi:hypothetical protein